MGNDEGSAKLSLFGRCSGVVETAEFVLIK